MDISSVYEYNIDKVLWKLQKLVLRGGKIF